MSVPTIQFEAKLMGYAKSRNKDGDWTDIRLQVHPEETEELNRLKLGQRLQCVIVAIGDDEQPVTPAKPKKREVRGPDGPTDCRECGHPKSEHSYNGACYGLCGEFKPKGGELARRAGILCGDERFQQWLLRHDGFRPFMEEGPHPTGPEFFADFLRWLCGIESRAELDHNPEAAEKFKALEFEFKQAHGLVAERTR